MNDSLLERRYRVIGRGAPLFYDAPLHVVRGEGVWLYDAQGRRYLDAYNNVPVVGHCHPRVVEAIARQAGALNVHTRYLHDTVVQYAERLTATFEGQDMAIFTCTGSEANDLALRMARQLTGREGIICSNSTYHGNTAAVDELSTTFSGGRTGAARVRAVPFPQAYRPLRGLHGAALADAYVDEVRACIEHFRRSGIGLAGMLVCPIFANEGLPDVPAGFLQRATQLVREAGGLVIFDEVQAGFGRTGELWGHRRAGVIPDIVTLGKPMGNGHPIGGVISRASIVNAFRDRVMYFNTFGGNPVACAAALAVLDVIDDEGLVEHVRQLSPQVTRGLRDLMSEHEGIGDVRARLLLGHRTGAGPRHQGAGPRPGQSGREPHARPRRADQSSRSARQRTEDPPAPALCRVACGAPRRNAGSKPCRDPRCVSAIRPRTRRRCCSNSQ